MKILPQMCLWTRKKWLNFGSHPPPDLDPGIFWGILQHCKIGHFSTIWLVSPERLIEFSWTLYHKCILGQSPLNFGRNPDPGSGSGVRIRIRTIFSLADVCGLWLLLLWTEWAMSYESDSSCHWVSAFINCRWTGWPVSVITALSGYLKDDTRSVKESFSFA